MNDPRPYHDHGSWQGPCSAGRHALILAGGPPGPRPEAERAAYTAQWTRRSPDGLRCACCRSLLAATGYEVPDLERAP
mgnify:CR=1 FL=1